MTDTSIFPAAATVDGIPGVVAPGTGVRKISGGFKFTEGATANAAGEVFFVDQPNDQILRWSEQDGLSVFMCPAGHANGMCFAKDGTLKVCADTKMELWSVTPDKQVTVIAKGYGGKDFNGPNDVWAAPNGDCYLTDPFYGRPWWTHKEPPQVTRQVYHLPKGGSPRRVTHDLVQPNGIIGTPDGRKLYISDINAGKTYVYDIAADGSLDNRRLFCEKGSDGMAIDCEGRVYLTAKGVFVYSPGGELLGMIPVPEPWCGNVCIGGPQHNILYITASRGFYSVPLLTKAPTGE